MPDQTQLVQSIYSAIFNGLPSSGDSHLCLEWPGMPVSADEYDNAWTAANSSGSQPATQAFSALVDPIPNDSAVYFPSGLGVESVYGLILQATVSTGPASQTFANAQTKFANLVIGSSLDNLATYHPAFAQPATWCSAGNSGWTSISVDLNPPAPPPPPPPHVQTAISQVLASQVGATGWRSAPINVANVHNLSVPIRKTPVATTGQGINEHSHPLAMMSAASPMQTHAVSAAVTASSAAALNRTVQTRSVSQVLAHPVTPPRAPLSPALLKRLANLPDGVIMPHPVTPIPTQPILAQPVQSKPITSSSLHLTLQCMRVNIVREWLDPLVLRLGNWTMDGLPSGSISTGTSDGNTGFFPLLPLSFLVVRNVSITGTWSAEDKALATQAATAGTAVAFGPLTLSNAAASQSVFNGSTLTVSGMQVIAWMCMPIPKLPPL